MFKLRICSDLDHEEIVADVCWNNQTIATINQDNGLENLEVELFPPPINQDSWKLPYKEMVEIFLKAKQELYEMQKFPD